MGLGLEFSHSSTSLLCLSYFKEDQLVWHGFGECCKFDSYQWCTLEFRL